jgi:hypothetical protein
MTKPDDSNPRDAAVARPGNVPAKPVAAKPKANPRPAATKAEMAAQKRVDKMVIKRMRKR